MANREGFLKEVPYELHFKEEMKRKGFTGRQSHSCKVLVLKGEGQFAVAGHHGA